MSRHYHAQPLRQTTPWLTTLYTIPRRRPPRDALTIRHRTNTGSDRDTQYPMSHPPHNGRHSTWQHDTLFKMCKSGSTKAIPKWRVTLWVTPWHDNQSRNNPRSKVIGAQTRGWKMFLSCQITTVMSGDVTRMPKASRVHFSDFKLLQMEVSLKICVNRQLVNLSWDYAFRDSIPNFCELAIAWDWSELPRPATGKKGGETKGLPPQQLWLWWVCTYLSKIKIISIILTSELFTFKKPCDSKEFNKPIFPRTLIRENMFFDGSCSFGENHAFHISVKKTSGTCIFRSFSVFVNQSFWYTKDFNLTQTHTHTQKSAT